MKLPNTRINFFKISAKVIIPLTIIILVYWLWVIQPVMRDDWLNIHPHEYFRMPCLPANGQQIRYCFDGKYILTTSPFSFFRPWSLFTVIFVVTLIWKSLSCEPLLIRAILTLLMILGFPYLGQIGPWNLASSEYTVSVFWTILWYFAYKKVSEKPKNIVFWLSFFFMTFVAATWYEVWVVAFLGIILFLGIDATTAFLNKNPDFKNKFAIFFVATLAYLAVILFYLHTGSAVIDTRFGGQVGYTKSLFSGNSLILLISSTLASLFELLIKSLPVLFFMLYIKINKQFSGKLEKDFLLFTFLGLGAIMFVLAITFLKFPFLWRTKLLLMYVFAVWLFSFPKIFVENFFDFFRVKQYRKMFRFTLLVLTIFLLGYNAYFTYIYTNVDIKGWLEYRKMVVSHDPQALEGLCCRSLLFFRRGIQEVGFASEWGEQDDQYRFYFGPEFTLVKSSILAYWGEK